MTPEGLAYLHCDHSVVDHHLFRAEIGSDRGFVLVGEAFVYILIHKRGLAHAAVTQNDDFQE